MLTADCIFDQFVAFITIKITVYLYHFSEQRIHAVVNACISSTTL